MTTRPSKPSAPRSRRSAPASPRPGSRSESSTSADAEAGAGHELGPVSLFALGLNGIVGAGIFFAPAIVAASVAGARASWLYLAIAIGCLPVALVFARLSRAMPRDGGPCLYAERAFGHEVARAIGALVWVSALFSTATVTRALADMIAKALPAAMRAATVAPVAGVAIVVALALSNLRGLRLSALAWTALTALKIAPLVALVAIAPFVPSAGVAPAAASEPIGPALLAIMFALQGFEVVPLPAGRVRDPERNVPRATVASLVVAGVLYALIHSACARALPLLRDAVAPIPATAAIVGGPRLAWAIGAGVVASIAGITVGMHAMTPRYLAAISTWDAKAPIDDAESAMRRPIVISAVAVALMVAIGPVSALAGLSSIAVLGQYGVTAAALLVLALRRAEGLVPREAWPAPLAMIVVVVLLSQATRVDLAIAGAVISAAIGWGWIARRGIKGGSVP